MKVKVLQTKAQSHSLNLNHSKIRKLFPIHNSIQSISHRIQSSFDMDILDKTTVCNLQVPSSAQDNFLPIAAQDNSQLEVGKELTFLQDQMGKEGMHSEKKNNIQGMQDSFKYIKPGYRGGAKSR